MPDQLGGGCHPERTGPQTFSLGVVSRKDLRLLLSCVAFVRAFPPVPVSTNLIQMQAPERVAENLVHHAVRLPGVAFDRNPRARRREDIEAVGCANLVNTE